MLLQGIYLLQILWKWNSALLLGSGAESPSARTQAASCSLPEALGVEAAVVAALRTLRYF